MDNLDAIVPHEMFESTGAEHWVRIKTLEAMLKEAREKARQSRRGSWRNNVVSGFDGFLLFMLGVAVVAAALVAIVAFVAFVWTKVAQSSARCENEMEMALPHGHDTFRRQKPSGNDCT